MPTYVHMSVYWPICMEFFSLETNELTSLLGMRLNPIDFVKEVDLILGEELFQIYFKCKNVMRFFDVFAECAGNHVILIENIREKSTFHVSKFDALPQP